MLDNYGPRPNPGKKPNPNQAQMDSFVQSLGCRRKPTFYQVVFLQNAAALLTKAKSQNHQREKQGHTFCIKVY